MGTIYRPDDNIYKGDKAYGFTLSSGDQLIIDPGIVIAASSYGVYGSDSSSVVCNGTIYGSSGLYFKEFGSLTVGATGTISGNAGLVSSKTLSAVNNGHIFGSYNGTEFYGSTTFTNNGTVTAGKNGADFYGGVYLGSSHTYTKLTNTGLIETKAAGGYAIKSYDDNEAPDTILNKGTLKGNVFLAGGADVVDNLKGRVYGTIDTGAGADKITGGIYADTMTGGADKDTFYFKTRADAKAVDHITDFEHNKDDIALSKALFKLDPGQSVASALQDITAGFDKQGSNKHILYNHDTGWLYYDTDGKGGAAPIHFATLDNHPTISSGDIVMV